MPLTAKEGGKCFDANSDNAYAGDYPITRFLYVYVNAKPGSKLEPLRAEFVKFVLSKQGQMGTIKDGFFPVPSAVASQDLEVLGVE